MANKVGRVEALDRTLSDITKRFGEGAIMRLGEATQLKVEVIPTGSLALDLALGVGGVPRGRVTEDGVVNATLMKTVPSAPET